MKKLCLFAVFVLLLTGCKEQQSDIQHGIDLRDRLTRERCSFTANITADYGQYTYTFSMGCSTDDQGDLAFVVKAPESIAGITGKLSANSGFLTFDDTALTFPLLADGEVSPVSAPWILVNTLRGGYLISSGEDGDFCRLTFKDSYQDDALQVDVWLNNENVPESAVIFWKGRSVLSLHIEKFVFV